MSLQDWSEFLLTVSVECSYLSSPVHKSRANPHSFYIFIMKYNYKVRGNNISELLKRAHMKHSI